MPHLSSKPFLIFPLLAYAGVFFILSPHITHAAGTTYYVSKQGSDSNDCTTAQNPATAKLTIMDGLTCLGPGDTLNIRGGTYSDQIDANSQTIPSGTQSNPITIQGHAGETVILGALNLAVSSASPTLQYITWQNLIVDGTGTTGPGGACVSLRSVGSSNVNHLIFQDMEIRNCYHNGVSIFGDPNTGVGADFNHLIRVSIHDTGLGDMAFAIYIGTNDNLIDSCTIYNANAGAIQINYSGGPFAPSRNVVRNNLISNVGYGVSGPSGVTRGLLTLGNGSDNVAYNNVIHDNDFQASLGLYTVALLCSDGTNNQFYNNTTYKNANGIGDTTCSNSVYKNNILYLNSDQDIWTGGGTATFAGNLCTRSGTNCANVGDPQFINASGNDFHLSPSSPAINTGISLSEVPCDFDGNARPSGGAYDIGAYEYGATPGGGCAGTTPTPTPTPGACQQYTPNSQIPPGFGVPWDVLSPSTMLVKAECYGSTIILKAGNPQTTKTLYVYKTGYTAPSGASTWTPAPLIGSGLIAESWYQTQAQGSIFVQDTTTPLYYVAYTCQWTGSKWMCGCRDQACMQSYWQIQSFKR
jgi:hypothetical protein